MSKAPREIVMEGYLEKKSPKSLIIGHAWQKRYFVLVLEAVAGGRGNQKVLYYYKTQNDSSGTPQGDIPLNNIKAVIDQSKEKSGRFDIEVEGRTFYLRTENPQELQKWITALSALVAHNVNFQKPEHLPSSPAETMKLMAGSTPESSDFSQASDTIQMMSKGAAFIKYDHEFVTEQTTRTIVIVFYKKDSQPLGSLYWCEPGEKLVENANRALALHTLTDMYLGKQTKAMKSALASSASAEKCFSAVGKSPLGQPAEFHLEGDSKEQIAAWLYGINAIMVSKGNRRVMTVDKHKEAAERKAAAEKAAAEKAAAEKAAAEKAAADKAAAEKAAADKAAADKAAAEQAAAEKAAAEKAAAEKAAAEKAAASQDSEEQKVGVVRIRSKKTEDNGEKAALEKVTLAAEKAADAAASAAAAAAAAERALAEKANAPAPAPAPAAEPAPAPAAEPAPVVAAAPAEPEKPLDPDSVAYWLTNLGSAFTEYIKPFESNGVDLHFLITLGEDELTELGVKRLHIKKMMQALQALIDSGKYTKPRQVEEDVTFTPPSFVPDTEVGKFLHSLGGAYLTYYESFESNGVDMPFLLTLGDDDLEELGVSKLHRKKILQSIHDIRAAKNETQQVDGAAALVAGLSVSVPTSSSSSSSSSVATPGASGDVPPPTPGHVPYAGILSPTTPANAATPFSPSNVSAATIAAYEAEVGPAPSPQSREYTGWIARAEEARKQREKSKEAQASEAAAKMSNMQNILEEIQKAKEKNAKERAEGKKAEAPQADGLDLEGTSIAAIAARMAAQRKAREEAKKSEAPAADSSSASSETPAAEQPSS